MKVLRIYDYFPEWTHKPVKKTVEGKYFAPIVDEEGEPILFQIPRVYVQSDLMDGDGLRERFVDLLLTDDFDPLNTFFTNVDRAVVHYVKVRRDELFPTRKGLDEDQIDSRFTTSAAPTHDEAKSCLRCRTFCDLKVFSPDRDEIPPVLSDAKRTCDAVIRLKGVWFTKHRFGVTWELYQLRVREEPKPRVLGYKFRDDEDFDEDSDEDYAAF